MLRVYIYLHTYNNLICRSLGAAIAPQHPHCFAHLPEMAAVVRRRPADAARRLPCAQPLPRGSKATIFKDSGPTSP